MAKGPAHIVGGGLRYLILAFICGNGLKSCSFVYTKKHKKPNLDNMKNLPATWKLVFTS